MPIVSPGFTDSHFLREAFGTVAYGFFPMRTMDPELAARLIHSADERIAVEDLELGTGSSVHVAAYAGSMSRQTSVRLGGMALANGVLVHGPRHWACAVPHRRRRAEGRLGPQARARRWT